jgi:hypothetical protein
MKKKIQEGMWKNRGNGHGRNLVTNSYSGLKPIERLLPMIDGSLVTAFICHDPAESEALDRFHGTGRLLTLTQSTIVVIWPSWCRPAFY